MEALESIEGLTFLQQIPVRALPGDGEPAIFFEAEQVVLIVVLQVRQSAAYLPQCIEHIVEYPSILLPCVSHPITRPSLFVAQGVELDGTSARRQTESLKWSPNLSIMVLASRVVGRPP